jgi:hypothetical protein
MAAMPWQPKLFADLQRQVDTLQFKLMRLNCELFNKTQYAGRLEYLVRKRSERIDELNAKLEQARAQNHKLETECEHLTDMIRIMPQLDPAMLAPK